MRIYKKIHYQVLTASLLEKKENQIWDSIDKVS